MKLAVAIWNGRVSPVFDAARRVEVLDVREGEVSSRREMNLDSEPLRKAQQLVEAGVGTLVCGAISRPMSALLTTQGILLIPFVAGPFEKVVEAYLAGRLHDEQFAMPGCRRGWAMKRGCRGRRNRWRGA